MSKEIKLPEGNKFVDKMTKGWFGGWAGYLEYQKSKRVADAMAENEANKIKIAGELEEKVIREKIDTIEALEAADRFIEYENLYNVLTKSVPKITSKANGDIDIDKMKILKEVSKEFGSDEMQELISDILAGEYNNPGTYSKKTIGLVKHLSKEDIELFQKFGALIIDGSFVLGDLFKLSSTSFEALKKEGFLFIDYLYLQELGLITIENISQKLGVGKFNMKIGIEIIKLELDKEVVFSNKNILTRFGRELFKILEPQQNHNIFKMCEAELLSIGFKNIIKN